jgi:broad specificity phosphatase PhoE
MAFAMMVRMKNLFPRRPGLLPIITVKRFSALLFFSLLLVATAGAQQPTIFFVRHAEKAATGGGDPNLSKAGRARAKSLATILKDAGISAIYTTEVKRTRQTAAPVGKALQVTPEVIPANDQATLITRLKRSAGDVLVVGHSNTIPELVTALGITTPINIGDNDYDNLFVLVLGPEPRLIRLHYR